MSSELECQASEFLTVTNRGENINPSLSTQDAPHTEFGTQVAEFLSWGGQIQSFEFGVSVTQGWSWELEAKRAQERVLSLRSDGGKR